MTKTQIILTLKMNWQWHIKDSVNIMKKIMILKVP